MKSNFVFHHLGIATHNIEQCINKYKELGYTSSLIKIEPSQNVKVCFLSKEESPILEIVEPLNEDSPISNILKYSGTTPYHTCYEVKDIFTASNELSELNFCPVVETIKSEAMDNGLICYLYSNDLGLIELYQKA